MSDISTGEPAPGLSLERDPAIVRRLLASAATGGGAMALWLNAGRMRMLVDLGRLEVGRDRLRMRLPAGYSPPVDAPDADAVCVLNLVDGSLRFACRAVCLHVQDDGTFLSTAIPDVVYLLRRRAGFRVPMADEAWLYTHIDDDGSEQRLEVLDLSFGGVGVLAEPDFPDLERLEGARLELPGLQPLVTDFRICNRSPFMLRDSRPGLRLGLAFPGLPAVARSRLRAYVQRLESTSQ